jgi:hypothetical protein
MESLNIIKMAIEENIQTVKNRFYERDSVLKVLLG